MSQSSNFPILTILMIAIGGLMLYFNYTAVICSGWSIINPFCWIGAFITHSILLFGGVGLLIIGVIRLIFGK